MEIALSKPWEGVSMRKVLIMVENGVEDTEFLYPYYRFQEEGYKVDVVAPKAKETYILSAASLGGIRSFLAFSSTSLTFLTIFSSTISNIFLGFSPMYSA